MKDKIIKDNIVLGGIAGAIGGIIGMTFSYSMFLLGISPMSSINLAATLVVIDIINLSPAGIIFSIVVHVTVASLFGALLMYILRYSGKEYWALKGTVIGALTCIILHSYLIPLMRTEEQVRSLIFNEPSWGTMVTTHSIIGLVAAFIIVKHNK